MSVEADIILLVVAAVPLVAILLVIAVGCASPEAASGSPRRPGRLGDRTHKHAAVSA